MTARFDDLFTLNRQATVARLVSGAAHEVNNALQVISGSAELLMTSKELPETVREGLERIAGHSARAAAAMTGITVLSRAVTEDRTSVDLRDVAARAASLTRYSVARAGLSVSVETGDERLPVEANAPQLLLAVVNLIANAEQALDGCRSGRIIIALGRDGAFARLAVSDDGPGLSDQMATQAFDPFATTKPRPDSVGLGLPVARTIAETHGGTLSVEPSASGATFVLRVPLA